MDRRLLAALVLSFTLAGCGDDSSSDSPDRDDTSGATSDAPTSDAPSSSTTSEGSGVSELGEDDKSAIEDTILEFLVTGDCDLATDDYLLDLDLFSDEDTTREEACDAWEKVFTKPLFTKDDVVLTELQGSDGVATVLVGSDIAPDVTTLYQLSLVDGEWLVSGDEYNTDGL